MCTRPCPGGPECRGLPGHGRGSEVATGDESGGPVLGHGQRSFPLQDRPVEARHGRSHPAPDSFHRGRASPTGSPPRKSPLVLSRRRFKACCLATLSMFGGGKGCAPESQLPKRRSGRLAFSRPRPHRSSRPNSHARELLSRMREGDGGLKRPCHQSWHCILASSGTRDEQRREYGLYLGRRPSD